MLLKTLTRNIRQRPEGTAVSFAGRVVKRTRGGIEVYEGRRLLVRVDSSNPARVHQALREILPESDA